MPNSPIYLNFGLEVEPVVRARIDYAFRVFAAIYNYSVVSDPARAEICCTYGRQETRPCMEREFRIPARYRPRPASEEMPVLEKRRFAGEDVFSAHGVDERTGEPDWLGEIFEWLSASLELSIRERDAEGRIPFSATVFERQGISPFKPHVGILMAWMENSLQGNRVVETLQKAKSPISGVDHAVVCSHDIDYYYTHKAAAMKRLGKNLLISIASYRSPSFFLSNLEMATGLLRGKATGDYVPRMVEAIESLGFQSTIFAVAGGIHRRDPNYRVDQIGEHLRDAAGRGFGVGVHASYDSLTRPGTVKSEKAALGKILQQQPMGTRQHWLRFGEHKKLYREISEAGFTYDSSLGFSETCGFRNGASFAFPPYDFEKERPCSFLEIPLVVMDGSLLQASRAKKKAPQTLVDQILGESRRLGWGGVSVLWHNPMEPIQVPEEINKVFWSSARRQKENNESWMSAEEFIKSSLSRYHRAGLLKEIHADA